MVKDPIRRKEIQKKYYDTHREEIRKRQKERRERKLNEEKMKGIKYEVKNTFNLIEENEKFLIYSVGTLSGKHLGYEVRKRPLRVNEYGKDKWTFCDENQMKEWVKHH